MQSDLESVKDGEGKDAGANATPKRDRTHTEAEWDNVLGANVKALYYASRHAIPVMKDQQSGLFLNTGSISSVVGMSAQVWIHCSCSNP